MARDAGKGSRRPGGRSGGAGSGPRSGPNYGSGVGRGTPHQSGSSTGSKAMMWVALAIFTPGVVAFVAAVAYVVRGNA